MNRRNLLFVAIGSAIALTNLAWILLSNVTDDAKPTAPTPAERTPPPIVPTRTSHLSNVAPELREKIDRWIAENDLNEFGDAKGTAYTGGTPLFDETTGVSRERYAYLEEKMSRPSPTVAATPTPPSTPGATPSATATSSKR